MPLTNFIQKNLQSINDYSQSAIQWRAGRFANSVQRVEATNGDFADVVKNLPATLSRADVSEFFREDLYKGFVATIMWGGISRFRPAEIAENNERKASVTKLGRVRAILENSNLDMETRINTAVSSLMRGGENYFYGIGPSFFTKILYFLACDMELPIRPLIYDENMKSTHFALMPDWGQNPFSFYVLKGRKLTYAENTSFKDVYYPYCELMCRVASENGVDVRNLDAWLFGWPVNINLQMPNPREVVRREVDRIAETGVLV